MLKKIKNFSIALILLLGLVLAYAMYPRGEAALKGKTKLTYWGPVYYIDRAKVAIDEFEKMYPQYKVEVGTGASNGEDPTRFLMSVAGGVPPDLICFSRNTLAEWGSRGAFTDLTPYIEREKKIKDGIKKENYIQVAWGECIYQSKMFALPTDADNRTLFYDKDAFTRAGLVYKENSPEVLNGTAKVGEAKPPMTWKEMCNKTLETKASVDNEGNIKVSDKIDLPGKGIKENDIIVILSNRIPADVFRGRITNVKKHSLKVDFTRDQPKNLTSLPGVFSGNSTIKIINQDCYVAKLTKFDQNTGKLKSVAFIPLWGNSWFFLYGWQAGGTFMNKDKTVCTMDNSANVKALDFITDIYDCYGGYNNALAFQNSQSIIDPFMDGRIYMVVNINQYINNICNLKPNMSFGVWYPPLPEDQIKKGIHPFGWSGGWSVAIPSTAKNKEGAWLLAKWLTSFKAMKIINEYYASEQQSKGQLFVPTLNANKQINQFLKEKYIDSSKILPKDAIEAFNTVIELLPYSKYRPVTPVGQKLWDEQVRVAETACAHVKSAEAALQYAANQVQVSLNHYLNPPTGPKIPWILLIAIYSILIITFIIYMVIRQKRKKMFTTFQQKKWYEGYICASPWLIGFFTFGAGPIFFSIIISMSSYDILNPARFIGFSNYTALFNDPLFWKSLLNTLYMAISVPLGLALGLAMAVFLNHKLKTINIYRTVFYLPAIVPSVAAFILWIKVFDPNIGFLNEFLNFIGINNPPLWLSSYSWAKPALIIMGLWSVGGGMVIWLAGLKNIPTSLYDAAAVDGAGPWRRFWNITIPMLTPYIFFNLIMGLIGVFQIFEQAYIMTNGGPQDSTLFFAYKLFKEAFGYLNMGAASAMAWIMFFVVLAITLFNFWVGKKWVHYN